MSPSKRTIERYANCFTRQDWPGMLSMLTDDIERWEVGSPRPSRGKREFDQDIRPGPEVVRLQMEITRMTEEGNVVVAEGMVRVSLHNGNTIKVQYCNVFEFEGEKIHRITAFTALVK